VRSYEVVGAGGALTAGLWEVWSKDHAFTAAPVVVSYTTQPVLDALQQFAGTPLLFLYSLAAFSPHLDGNQMAFWTLRRWTTWFHLMCCSPTAVEAKERWCSCRLSATRW
jgi:hypothetical protein